MPYVGTSPHGDLSSSHSGTAQVVREVLFIRHFPLLPSGPQTKCVSPPPRDSSLEQKDRHKDLFSRTAAPQVGYPQVSQTVCVLSSSW